MNDDDLKAWHADYDIFKMADLGRLGYRTCYFCVLDAQWVIQLYIKKSKSVFDTFTAHKHKAICDSCFQAYIGINNFTYNIDKLRCSSCRLIFENQMEFYHILNSKDTNERLYYCEECWENNGGQALML